MKSTQYRGPGLALAAIFAIAPVAVAAEPLAEGKFQASGASGGARATQEAHGLLGNRFSTPTASAETKTAANEDSFFAPDSADSVALASWISLESSRMASLAIQLPPTYDEAPLPSENDACNLCDCCSNPLWCQRNSVFVDLLYLRPGNIDYVYAVEQTGTLPTDSPTGPVGRVGFDGAPGYRLGFNHCLSDCSSIQASYTWFQAGTNNTINATPGTVLLFQPGVPGIPNVGAASIQSSARYDIRFQQIDLDYRGLLYGTCNSAVNYFAGLRYANLSQRFSAQEDVGVPVGFTTARSEINFDGFGIGAGLDGMRRSAYSGLLAYGRASTSFVAGEFKADFRQTAQFGPNAALGNTLVDYRVMTILQSELGLGWQSQSGAIRLTAGYMFAGWFNALTTGSYIPGVQNRRFDNLNETITFDGLVTRLEWRY